MDSELVRGGAVVAGTVALLYALRPYLLKRKPDYGQMAGYQDKSFWEQRFDKIDQAIATIDRISREHRSMNREEIEQLRSMLIDIEVSIKGALNGKNRRGD